ncbi:MULTISPECIES: SWIM zinc finger family protein [Streptomyces]|uniref:SWIM zinc finger family protein n=1 Tax=Streptomyces edwardsiae TaxID=3075527 RepID=A0ABU2Q095_9ACTN|nr:SWIM zinc finger family protein [Streptomyces sp. DSM 41636]MDT0396405.1 SWIM zinc finger family protein [Streptomyces sp. DSM 41636]
MTEQGVRWTADQVLALAPDAASRAAGSELGAAGPWSGAGSSGEGVVWGLCEAGGGGDAPYRTVVDVSGPEYGCSCPGRGSPCEHALGLLLLWSGGGGAVARGEAPEWAERWIKGVRAKGPTDAPDSPGAADPEAARRRAGRRAERVTAGTVELEQRLADLLRGGLASAERSGDGLWEETAARMVDAQAPGLAARVRELASLPGTGADRPVRLLEECALLHLLGRGWRHRERLPEGLAATVRSRIGLTARADGPSIRDRWLVLAQYDTADSRLTTRRIWLYGTGTGRTALLLSYGAAGRAPELALPVGPALDAELSAYPGTGQSRAALGERFAPPAPTDVRPPGTTTAGAAARYGEALRDDPWLDSVPVTLDRVIPAPDGEGWQLADADEDTALPLTPAARSRPGLWRLVALSGGGPVRVFGECGHQGFTPLAAWPEGAGEMVPLC